MTNIAGYEMDLLVVGFPGKSICHGGLGWSTIALLRGHGRVVLIDTGPMGMRKLLMAKLKALGLAPSEVTDVLLTHAHHDHSINWVLFPEATIAIGDRELDWSLRQPWGETPVPELYMRELAKSPRLLRLRNGDRPLPHVIAYEAPGHTPGHLWFVLEDAAQDVLFLGDAAKTRAELASRTAQTTQDAKQSAASMDLIWDYWQRKPQSLVIPGHDVPLAQSNGVIRYLQAHEAAVQVCFGDDLNASRNIVLTQGLSP